jgi:hypothetical protein
MFGRIEGSLFRTLVQSREIVEEEALHHFRTRGIIRSFMLSSLRK